MVRDAERCQKLVRDFYQRGVLVVGLTYPIVPHGDDTIRFQVNAAHTAADIDQVLNTLEDIS
jgi:glycine C-acetyltransferase